MNLNWYLVIIVIWYLIGLFANIWLVIVDEDLKVKDLFLVGVGAISGPLVFLINWVIVNQEKIIFKKRRSSEEK